MNFEYEKTYERHKLIWNWFHRGDGEMLLAGLEIAARFRDGGGQELLDEIEHFYGAMSVAFFISSFGRM